MTAMLASVRSLDEALLALEEGADFIDLKEPSRGALGALDHAAVRICVRAVDGRRPVSATIGDQPDMDPPSICDAVERLAATGVDLIKIGFFAHERAAECARSLSILAGRHRLVAVLFADEAHDTGMTDQFADSGFAGAMLDTARKTGRSLTAWKTKNELSTFLRCARQRGLLAGLAGSLRAEDVEPLLALEPDFLGFRGALCSGGERTRLMDARAFSLIRKAIPRTLASGIPNPLAA